MKSLDLEKQRRIKKVIINVDRDKKIRLETIIFAKKEAFIGASIKKRYNPKNSFKIGKS